MQLAIFPCPSPAVVLHRYDSATFPAFAPLFEAMAESSPLRHFARDPDEAMISIVLENRSEKAITAWRYQWATANAAGEHRIHKFSGDSYGIDLFRPVAEPRSRHLITPSARVDEASLKQIGAGGGFIASASGGKRSWTDVVELTFEIEFLLFADGEIAGLDPDRYALELQCRKRGAEFIAKQIRLAEADGRDVTPVLTALAEAPSLGGLGHPQGDPLFHWVRHYAKDFLRSMHRKLDDFDVREAKLRHMENRPDLPRFYRRQPPAR
jgi:hypothetical protein